MLVLTRRLGESICINDDIKIVIQSIKGHQVRIGITAPKQTVIHREEIYQKIQHENRQASQGTRELSAMQELVRNLKQAQDGQGVRALNQIKDV